MQIEHTYVYPASVDETFAVITDPALYDAVAVRSRALEHTAQVTDVHQVHTISLERKLPTDEVPSFAKALVGDALLIRETTWWKRGAPNDGDAPGYHATFDVQIVGKPVTFQGTMRLLPDGDQTKQQIVGTVTASVPLFGSKIEQAVKEPIDHQVRAVAQMVTERLGGEWHDPEGH